MTKKDYELIAKAVTKFNYDMGNYFGANEGKTRRAIVTDIAQRLVDALEQANPKFDRNKFLQACGIEDKVYKSYGDLPAFDKPALD